MQKKYYITAQRLNISTFPKNISHFHNDRHRHRVRFRNDALLEIVEGTKKENDKSISAKFDKVHLVTGFVFAPRSALARPANSHDL